MSREQAQVQIGEQSYKIGDSLEFETQTAQTLGAVRKHAALWEKMAKTAEWDTTSLSKINRYLKHIQYLQTFREGKSAKVIIDASINTTKAALFLTKPKPVIAVEISALAIYHLAPPLIEANNNLIKERRAFEGQFDTLPEVQRVVMMSDSLADELAIANSSLKALHKTADVWLNAGKHIHDALPEPVKKWERFIADTSKNLGEQLYCYQIEHDEMMAAACRDLPTHQQVLFNQTDAIYPGNFSSARAGLISFGEPLHRYLKPVKLDSDSNQPSAETDATTASQPISRPSAQQEKSDIPVVTNQESLSRSLPNMPSVPRSVRQKNKLHMAPDIQLLDGKVFPCVKITDVNFGTTRIGVVFDGVDDIVSEALNRAFDKKYEISRKRISYFGVTYDVKVTPDPHGMLKRFGGRHVKLTVRSKFSGEEREVSFKLEKFDINHKKNQKKLYELRNQKLDELIQHDFSIKNAEFMRAYNQLVDQRKFVEADRIHHDFFAPYGSCDSLVDYANKTKNNTKRYRISLSRDLKELDNLRQDPEYHNFVESINKRSDQLHVEVIEGAVKAARFDDAYQEATYLHDRQQHQAASDFIFASELKHIQVLRESSDLPQMLQLSQKALDRFVIDQSLASTEKIEIFEFLIYGLNQSLREKQLSKESAIQRLYDLQKKANDTDIKHMCIYYKAMISGQKVDWRVAFDNLSQTNNPKLMDKLYNCYDALTLNRFAKVDQYAAYYRPEADTLLDEQRQLTTQMLETYARVDGQQSGQQGVDESDALPSKQQRLKEDLERINAKQAFLDQKDVLLAIGSARFGVDFVIDVWIQSTQPNWNQPTKEQIEERQRFINKLNALRGILNNSLSIAEETIKQMHIPDYNGEGLIAYFCLSALTSCIDAATQFGKQDSDCVKEAREFNTVLTAGLDFYSLVQLCNNVGKALDGQIMGASLPGLALNVISRIPGLTSWLLDEKLIESPQSQSVNPLFIGLGELIREFQVNPVVRYTLSHGTTILSLVMQTISDVELLNMLMASSGTVALIAIVSYCTFKVLCRIPSIQFSRKISNILMEKGIYLTLEGFDPLQYRKLFYEAWLNDLSRCGRLKRRSVAGDGNCLFHAISFYTKEDALQLRQLAIGYEKSHPQQFTEFFGVSDAASTDVEGIESETLNIHIQNLERGGDASDKKTWGGEHEIEALEHVLGRPIIVVCDDGQLSARECRLIKDIEQLRKPILIEYNKSTQCYSALLMCGEPYFQEIYEYKLREEQQAIMHSMRESQILAEKRDADFLAQSTTLEADCQKVVGDITRFEQQANSYQTETDDDKKFADLMEAFSERSKGFSSKQRHQLKLRFGLWKQQYLANNPDEDFDENACRTKRGRYKTSDYSGDFSVEFSC